MLGSAKTLFRQVHARDRSLAGLAVDLDRAAMQFDQPLGQRQSEAYAVMLSGEAVADLPKRRQRYRYLIGRHANAGVLDPKGDALGKGLLDRQAHRTARRRELDRVGQQIRARQTAWQRRRSCPPG